MAHEQKPFLFNVFLKKLIIYSGQRLLIYYNVYYQYPSPALKDEIKIFVRYADLRGKWLNSFLMRFDPNSLAGLVFKTFHSTNPTVESSSSVTVKESLFYILPQICSNESEGTVLLFFRSCISCFSST